MPDQTSAQAPSASRCSAVGPETGDPCIGVSGHDGGHPFAPSGRPIHATALTWLLDATKMPIEQAWTMVRKCTNEHEPDGNLCPGFIKFGPSDPQAACTTCGAWEGCVAPGWRDRIVETPAVNPLVAAVLAVMPTLHGEVLLESFDRRTTASEWDESKWGPPEPLAAKYVAAVLSAAADALDPDHRNIEGIVRWMRARANEVDPVIRLDMLDFPTAWEIQRRGVEHNPRCSSVPGWSPISGPALLCDCGAVETEWRRLVAEHEAPKETR